ncbi:hypothetical protein X975_26525, partial [Stegodyphus mimosarum]
MLTSMAVTFTQTHITEIVVKTIKNNKGFHSSVYCTVLDHSTHINSSISDNYNHC